MYIVPLSNLPTVQSGSAGETSAQSGGLPFREVMQQAVELVINQVNEEGGINGMKVELDIQDDQCTTEGAINAMNKCISDGCQVVIGPHRSANAVQIK